MIEKQKYHAVLLACSPTTPYQPWKNVAPAVPMFALDHPSHFVYSAKARWYQAPKIQESSGQSAV